jgi:hypothetical protein
MSLTQLYEYTGNNDRRSIIGDAGDDTEKPTLGSVMRLRTWIVQFWQNGDTYPVAQQYLYKYALKETTSTFSISRDFYEWCHDGEFIDLDLLKKINSLTAQALYFYLRVHRTNRRPKLTTLIRALALPTGTSREKYDAKREIVRAFDRLEKLHIIRPDFSGEFFHDEAQQFSWFLDWNFYGGRTIGYSATSDKPSVLSDWIFTHGRFPDENEAYT